VLQAACFHAEPFLLHITDGRVNERHRPGGLAITGRKAVVNVRGSDRSMTDGDTQLMQIADNVADGI
jgi:hypothetical protein